MTPHAPEHTRLKQFNLRPNSTATLLADRTEANLKRQIPPVPTAPVANSQAPAKTRGGGFSIVFSSYSAAGVSSYSLR